MRQTRYGLPLSTSSAEAADSYNASIDAALGFDEGALGHTEAAIAADESFAMAHIHRARALQLEGRIPEAQASKRRALDLAGSATPFEQAHIGILALAIDGEGPAALAAITSHLVEYPCDAFACAQAIGPFGLFAFGGYQDRHELNLALLESVKPAYGDDWWFLTSYAFGLNELNRFSESAPLADRAFELRPTGSAAHTVSHVKFETGDASDGIRFLDEFLPRYPRTAQISSHLSWHLALFELAQGNGERVNALLREYVRPAISAGSALSRLADGASLLWRQRLLGVETVPGAEREVSDFASQSFARPGVTFADLHCALAYGAAGDDDRLASLASQLREREAAGKIAAGTVVPAVAEAIRAFSREDYATAISLLEPVASQVVKVGGSNAQREVFEDTLLEAYLRDGRSEPAIALIERRLDRRPNPLDSARLSRARALTPA